MGRFVLRRVGLAVLTLWLLATIVFVGIHVLPGDVGRRILGPFAAPEAVATLNHQLGADRPLAVQYWDWLSSAVRGDLGESLSFRVPVSSLLGPAVLNSLKLALVAFLLVVPLGILGGIAAGLSLGRAVDRLVTVGGLSATVVPEFVSSIVVILVFAVQLRWLPVTAQAPAGSGPGTQFRYLARITRAGMVEALDAAYTRTAVLKGISQRTVIVRHVLRNALLPTIAVVATQTGYLIGGLVVIEFIFNYQGLGQLTFQAAQKLDFPLLQGTVMVMGIVFLLTTLVADIGYSLLNPRIRYGSTE